MKIKSNHQDLLKTIAIIAMIVDHLGLYIFPEYIIMRVIGRIAMPIFCFFAGYNYKNVPRLLVLLFGILLYDISIIIFFWQFVTTNILISIFLGQCYISLFREQLKDFSKAYIHVILLGVLWAFTWEIFDYGTLAIAIMILGYIVKYNRDKLKLATGIAIIISTFHTIAVFNLSHFYLGLYLTLCMATYLLLIIKDFSQGINLNLKPVSRNVLFIYFAHVALIQIYWLYFIVPHYVFSA